jgi:hypothetical protein
MKSGAVAASCFCMNESFVPELRRPWHRAWHGMATMMIIHHQRLHASIQMRPHEQDV